MKPCSRCVQLSWSPAGVTIMSSSAAVAAAGYPRRDVRPSVSAAGPNAAGTASRRPSLAGMDPPDWEIYPPFQSALGTPEEIAAEMQASKEPNWYADAIIRLAQHKPSQVVGPADVAASIQQASNVPSLHDLCLGTLARGRLALLHGRIPGLTCDCPAALQASTGAPPLTAGLVSARQSCLCKTLEGLKTQAEEPEATLKRLVEEEKLAANYMDFAQRGEAADNYYGGKEAEGKRNLALKLQSALEWIDAVRPVPSRVQPDRYSQSSSALADVCADQYLPDSIPDPVSRIPVHTPDPRGLYVPYTKVFRLPTGSSEASYASAALAALIRTDALDSLPGFASTAARFAGGPGGGAGMGGGMMSAMMTGGLRGGGGAAGPVGARSSRLPTAVRHAKWLAMRERLAELGFPAVSLAHLRTVQTRAAFEMRLPLIIRGVFYEGTRAHAALSRASPSVSQSQGGAKYDTNAALQGLAAGEVGRLVEGFAALCEFGAFDLRRRCVLQHSLATAIQAVSKLPPVAPKSPSASASAAGTAAALGSTAGAGVALGTTSPLRGLRGLDGDRTASPAASAFGSVSDDVAAHAAHALPVYVIATVAMFMDDEELDMLLDQRPELVCAPEFTERLKRACAVYYPSPFVFRPRKANTPTEPGAHVITAGEDQLGLDDELKGMRRSLGLASFLQVVCVALVCGLAHSFPSPARPLARSGPRAGGISAVVRALRAHGRPPDVLLPPRPAPRASRRRRQGLPSKHSHEAERIASPGAGADGSQGRPQGEGRGRGQGEG